MNRSDIGRDTFMLEGKFADKGYDWWWHSFSARNVETGETRSFFIEFFTCNPSLGDKDPVFKPRPSYLMVKVGSWGSNPVQLHRFFGWDSVSVKKDIPFEVMAGDCFLGESFTTGHVTVSEDQSKDSNMMCQAGQMSWKLNIDKRVAFNVGYGASNLLRKIKAFDMYWHAQGMKTVYEGEVIFNSVVYKVDPITSYGYADKNWGSDFTSPWVWLSSCNLKSKKTARRLVNSVFDIGGGRPVVFNHALNRKLLGELYYEGQDYEFNFSKFWTFSKTRFDCQETEDLIIWHVQQDTIKYRLITDVTCKKSDMLLVNYVAPDGKKRHNRLFNGGNGVGTLKLYRKTLFKGIILVDEIEAENVGCEYGEYC